jgi:hypothetical protein
MSNTHLCCGPPTSSGLEFTARCRLQAAFKEINQLKTTFLKDCSNTSSKVLSVGNKKKL